MRSSVTVALLLWAILALAVFSVTFDWQARVAGYEFVAAQVQRRAQGVALETIENGFRPRVRAAAWQSSVWLLLILGGGSGAVLMAARRHPNNAF
jgi:hypothetical protein